MKIVIFTSNNARVIYNPENIEEYRNRPNCLIDPDLSKVAGLAPHYWRLVNESILPVPVLERPAIDTNHAMFGSDNDITRGYAEATIVNKSKPTKIPRAYQALVLIALVIVVGVACYLKYHK